MDTKGYESISNSFKKVFKYFMDDQRNNQEIQDMERKKRDGERDKKMLDMISVVNTMWMKNSSLTNKIDSEVKETYSTKLPASCILVTLKFLDLPTSKIQYSVPLPNTNNHLHTPSSASNKHALAEVQFIKTK